MAISPVEYAQRVQAGRGQWYRVAFCYVKNEQDALDIVGEAVYRGLASLKALRQAEYFDTWMTRIVINTALSHLRKGGRLAQNQEELPLELSVPETGLTVEDTLDLYAVLDVLTAEERSYIILRFFQERSFREIAEILSQPEPTVKSRLYRILGKLKQQLSK